MKAIVTACNPNTQPQEGPSAPTPRSVVGASSDAVLPQPEPTNTPKPVSPDDTKSPVVTNPLATAIIDTFGKRGFDLQMQAIIKAQGNVAVAKLWPALEAILGSDIPNRVTITERVLSLIHEFYATKPASERVAPSAQFVGRFSQVMTRPEVVTQCRSDILYSWLTQHFHQVVIDQSNHEALGALCKSLAMRNDRVGLLICTWFKQSYNSVQTGPVDQTAHIKERFLWKTRDSIVADLMRSPDACVRNFKLHLLFEASVPHPCLDFPVQPLKQSEHWLLNEMFRLPESHRPVSIEQRQIRSDDFAPGAFNRDVTPLKRPTSAGSQPHCPAEFLASLYELIGLDPESGRQVSISRRCMPRTWVSSTDEERFRKSCVRTIFKTVIGDSRTPGGAGMHQGDVTLLLENIAREYPYALAQAIGSSCELKERSSPRVQKLGEILDDVIHRSKPDASLDLSAEEYGKKMCDYLALKGSLLAGYELAPPEALQEFERCLACATEDDLKGAKLQTYISAFMWSRAVTPVVEEHALRLMEGNPTTIGASLLAKYLFLVQCPDQNVKNFVVSQASRSDLPAPVWLNYAHAAVGFGLESQKQQLLCGLYENVYSKSLESWFERDAQARWSGSLIKAVFYPEKLFDVELERGSSSGVHRSNNEKRAIGTLESFFKGNIHTDTRVQNAPSVDGLMSVPGYDGKNVALFYDGEQFHSVMEIWCVRGFDGSSKLATRIFTQAGYPVLRISEQLSVYDRRQDLLRGVAEARDFLRSGIEFESDILVINPPDDFTDIAGKVILYTP